MFLVLVIGRFKFVTTPKDAYATFFMDKFSMATNINLIDEYYIQLEAICKVFERKDNSKEEKSVFQLFVPYV